MTDQPKRLLKSGRDGGGSAAGTDGVGAPSTDVSVSDTVFHTILESPGQLSRERTMRSASSAMDPIMRPAMISRTVLVATFTGLAMTS